MGLINILIIYTKVLLFSIYIYLSVKMAARRVTKTSVDWAKMQSLLPAEQQGIYSALIAKNFAYTVKVAALPESLPKIDFAGYRKQLVNPSAIDALEKAYTGFEAAYPKDAQNQLNAVDQFERTESARLVEFLKSAEAAIKKLDAEKFKLNNIPPLENMTKELEVYYFPEKAEDFGAEYIGEEDLYAKMLTDKKAAH